MTALTSTGSVPDVGDDDDAWGGILNIEIEAQYADLQMLNTAPANTILGRNEGTSGDVERLTVTEATAMLNAVVGDSGSGGTKGLVPAPATGDAAARKSLYADGTWKADEIKAWGLFTGATGATVAARNISCVRNSASNFTFTFTTPLANADYALFINPSNLSAADGLYLPVVSTKTATGFVIQTIADVGGTVLGGVDPEQISVQVLGA